MRTKTFAAALVAAAALALPLVAAAPASAATLPAGDNLYALSCNRDADTAESFSLLYSVNPADAIGTLIGDGSGIEDDCAYQAAYNPVTGNSYYLSAAKGDIALARIDVATGDTTIIPWTGDWEGEYPLSIAIGKDGAGYAIAGDNLLSLNVETGALHGLGDLNVSGLFGFSVDPTSGLFYAVSDSGPAWKIDVSAVTATWLGNVDVGSGNQRLTLQIDTSGAWWITVDQPEESIVTSGVWTGARPADENPSFFTLVGTLDDVANEYAPYSESLLITYPKALPATGTDASSVVGAGVAAMMLLLAGSVVLVVRRRRAV